MKKTCLWLLLIIAAFLAGRYWPTPRPGPAVIVNPGPGDHPDINITQESHGNMSGYVPLPSPAAQTDLGGDNTPGNTPTPTEAPRGLLEGQSVDIPISGSIHTRYTINGKPAGEGDHPVTGTATVGVTDGNVTADVTFDDTVTEGIVLPVKRWDLSAAVWMDTEPGISGEIGYNLDDHWQVFARGDWMYNDNRVTVGVRYNLRF